MQAESGCGTDAAARASGQSAADDAALMAQALEEAKAALDEGGNARAPQLWGKNDALHRGSTHRMCYHTPRPSRCARPQRDQREVRQCRRQAQDM